MEDNTVYVFVRCYSTPNIHVNEWKVSTINVFGKLDYAMKELEFEYQEALSFEYSLDYSTTDAPFDNGMVKGYVMVHKGRNEGMFIGIYEKKIINYVSCIG